MAECLGRALRGFCPADFVAIELIDCGGACIRFSASPQSARGGAVFALVCSIPQIARPADVGVADWSGVVGAEPAGAGRGASHKNSLGELHRAGEYLRSADGATGSHFAPCPDITARGMDVIGGFSGKRILGAVGVVPLVADCALREA